MKANEEHEKAIREYLGVNDSSITEYEHIEENKYYVTLLIVFELVSILDPENEILKDEHYSNH